MSEYRHGKPVNRLTVELKMLYQLELVSAVIVKQMGCGYKVYLQKVVFHL